MTRSEELAGEIQKAVREIERRLDAPHRTDGDSSRTDLELVQEALQWLKDATAALSPQPEHGDARGGEARVASDAELLERIQSRFDGLPRKGSVVDELIAERRVEAWRDELDSYGR